jgi:hypothetical protein
VHVGTQLQLLGPFASNGPWVHLPGLGTPSQPILGLIGNTVTRGCASSPSFVAYWIRVSVIAKMSSTDMS